MGQDQEGQATPCQARVQEMLPQSNICSQYPAIGFCCSPLFHAGYKRAGINCSNCNLLIDCHMPIYACMHKANFDLHKAFFKIRLEYWYCSGYQAILWEPLHHLLLSQQNIPPWRQLCPKVLFEEHVSMKTMKVGSLTCRLSGLRKCIHYMLT